MEKIIVRYPCGFFIRVEKEEITYPIANLLGDCPIHKKKCKPEFILPSNLEEEE